MGEFVAQAIFRFVMLPGSVSFHPAISSDIGRLAYLAF